jgi:predicted transcriptional regulator
MQEATRSIREQSIADLFSENLSDIPCVFIDHDREVWLATEMCAEYTESSVDQIVVLDKNNIVGTVGGYDLLAYIRRNPTRKFQYESKVENVMFTPVPIIDKSLKFRDLMEKWKHSRRAFSIFRVGFDSNWFSISARKVLQVGLKVPTNFSTLSIQKNRIVTFNTDDTIGNILDLMYKNMTRKLLLENSNQFISDRILLGEISRILKFEENVEDILDFPISHIRLEYVTSVNKDLKLNEVCSIINKSDHPYLMYKDTVVTPWDICLVLSSEDLQVQQQQEGVCPTCGRQIEPSP